MHGRKLYRNGFLGVDPDLAKEVKTLQRYLLTRLESLEDDGHSFLKKNEWSDVDAHIEGPVGILRRVMENHALSVDSKPLI